MRKLLKKLYHNNRLFHILINKIYNFYLTSKLLNPYLRGHKLKRLDSDMDFFISKILRGENFAFARNADGERAIMQGISVESQEKKWTSPDYVSKLGIDILDSLNVVDKNFYYAISCPCCDREAYYWYASRICNNGVSASNLTFSNLWINRNFRRFKREFERIKRDCILIANYRARGAKIGNLNVLKHYEIDDDCISFWENRAESMLELIKKEFGSARDLLFVVSCGPMSSPIIKSLFLHNPNNTYVDFGSSIDSYYIKTQTRPYQDKNSLFGSRNCYMYKELDISVSVVLTLYKRGDLLAKQVEAVMGQSVEPREVVLFIESQEQPLEHSSLGNHSVDFENFEGSQTISLASPSKFSKNYESTTANIRMLGDSNAMEGVESYLDSNIKATLDSNVSRDFNAESKLDSKDSTKENSKSLDSTLCVESNKNNPHEVRPIKSVVGGGGESCERGGGERASRLLAVARQKPKQNLSPLPLSQGIDRVGDDNIVGDSKGLKDSKLDFTLDSNKLEDSKNLVDSALDSKVSTTLPKELESKFSQIISPKYNVGVWGRFSAGLLAKSKYICFFDDDTIPAKRWLENCTHESLKRDALYGGIGILSNNLSKYPFDMAHRTIGWNDNPPFAINNKRSLEVDFVGHSWFLKRDYLGAMWINSSEFYKMHNVAEDAYLSFALKKYLDIKTFVPPHKDREFFSSTLGLECGKGDEGISSNNENLLKMNKALKLLKKQGMREVSFSLKWWILSNGNNILKKFISKEKLHKLKERLK